MPVLQSIIIRPKHCDPLYLLRELGLNYEYCALLESVDRKHWKNDYSFLALGARDVYKSSDQHDPLRYFEDKIGSGAPGQFLQMGYIGFVSYETVRFFDSVDLKTGHNTPDAEFFLPELLLKIDHQKREVVVIAHRDTAEDLDQIKKVIEQSPFYPDNPPPKDLPLPSLKEIESYRQMSRDEYCEAVKKIQAGILDGETFQVVLSQELRLPETDPSDRVYEHLRSINPSPYMYYCKMPQRVIVGASPETLIRVDGRQMSYRPIAGTRKRTNNEEQNENMKAELLADQKERCEHQMLVDLGRNDVGRVAEIGSVTVENAFHIEQYSHVYHIVSDVHGILAKDKTCLDALKAVFPAGTLTGAPKLRAMEVIGGLEKSPRGIYGGAFGYIDLAGNLDMAIVIRTMIFEDGEISIRVGAGIVKDSVPELEDNECLHKARSCLAAVKLAQRGEDCRDVALQRPYNTFINTRKTIQSDLHNKP